MNIRMNELHFLCENDVWDNNIPSYWKFYKKEISKLVKFKNYEDSKISNKLKLITYS
jgi:hypothetical protein